LKMKTYVKIMSGILVLICQLLVSTTDSFASDGLFIEVITQGDSVHSRQIFIDAAKIKSAMPDSALTKTKTKGSEVTWLGVNLCRLLKNEAGVICDEISKITATAPDGYTSVLTGELLPALPTGILAFQKKGSQSWPESYGYARLVFPDLRAMYWVNGPDKFTIIVGRSQKHKQDHHLYFLNSKMRDDFLKSDSDGKSYFSVAELFDALNLPNGCFQTLSSDGLFREYPAHEVNQRILFHQERNGMWEITGVGVPSGLKLFHVFFLANSNTGIFLCDLEENQQVQWMDLYWKSVHPEDGRFEVIKVLKDGQKEPVEIPAEAGSPIQLYKILESEMKAHDSIDYFIVN